MAGVVLPIDENRLKELCQKNDIVSLGVFGSYARGDFDASSDIDLIAEFDKSKKKGLLDLVSAEMDFKEAMAREVDLLTEGSISPYLIDRIKGEMKYIYKQ